VTGRKTDGKDLEETEEETEVVVFGQRYEGGGIKMITWHSKAKTVTVPRASARGCCTHILG